MQLQIHNSMRDAQRIPATEVIVFNGHGTPVAVIVDLGDNVIQVYSAADGSSFNRVLKALGINDSVSATAVAIPVNGCSAC